ncbi:MAG TPA: hypothetical protein VGF28_02825 [Thermoanaerobaculia bacterium]|jgi:uncharacterized paraquat-inducible protein A
MTPAPDLVECVNCDCLFAAASLDDVFYHATSRCRHDAAAVTPPPAAETALFAL